MEITHFFKPLLSYYEKDKASLCLWIRLFAVFPHVATQVSLLYFSPSKEIKSRSEVGMKIENPKPQFVPFPQGINDTNKQCGSKSSPCIWLLLLMSVFVTNAAPI